MEKRPFFDTSFRPEATAVVRGFQTTALATHFLTPLHWPFSKRCSIEPEFSKEERDERS